MLQPLRANRARQKLAYGRSIPAPVEGWDALSALADMKPKRAVILENWFPQPGYIEVRRGHQEHAQCTAETANVETLMVWDNGASRKMFAAAGQDIYDVSAGGASAAVVSSLTSAQWRYVNFTTSGGHFLWICNGMDDPRHYNGTTWATPSITGVTANTIRSVAVHKHRLWFVLNDSLKAAYLAVDSIAGAATTFELGSVFTQGGRLAAICSWTIDGGAGPDDLLAFVTTEGQVAVYQGTNPGSADTWALVGMYDIPRPIGDRPLTRVAGDVAIITIAGVLPLSQALVREAGSAKNVALTARIDSAMNAAALVTAEDFGWQIISYPRGTAAILNVPITNASRYDQFVMNTLTGAWCRYKGQNALCWETMGETLYFGGFAGRVFEADTGSTDDGEPIVCDCKTAFNYFGLKGVLKRFTMLQSLVTTDGRAAPSESLDIDFRDGQSLGSLEPPITSTTLWDVAQWDVDVWPPEQVTSGDWKTVTGIGQCAAVRLRVSSGTASSLSLKVNGWHITFETGDFL